jgi:type I restriction enzyme S subunit
VSIEEIELNTIKLPAGWEWSTLGEVCEKSQYGWTTKANHESGSLKLLRTTDITSGQINWSTVPFCSEEPDDVEKYLLKSGDILISRAGSVGVSFLINKPKYAVFASYLIRFRPREIFDTKYLYYFLKSPDYWAAIGESKAGIAVQNVNASKLSEVRIPIAPLTQQKRIVAEIEKQFSRLDEAVANLKRVKANLKRYKATVLKAAVEGKLTEEWRKQHPDVEPADKLLERIIAERREKWIGRGKFKEPVAPDTTDLPKLPCGWIWASVQQIATVQLGKMLDKKKHIEGKERPYLRNVNVRWGTVETKDLLKMFFKDTEVDKFCLKAGDVLVCEGGEPGRASVWAGSVSGVMFQKALHRVRFYTGYDQNLLVMYLEYLAKSGRLERWFTGSTIRHFTRESFTTLPLPVPPIEEQAMITAEVERRISIISEAETQIGANLLRADRLRQSILNKAFSGQLAN